MLKSWVWRGICGMSAAASLTVAVGCQTYLGGMTLPSGHYLTDKPDYIPNQPQFPLQRELIAQQAKNRVVTTGVVPGAPPVAAPGGVFPGAAPLPGTP